MVMFRRCPVKGDRWDVRWGCEEGTLGTETVDELDCFRLATSLLSDQHRRARRTARFREPSHRVRYPCKGGDAFETPAILSWRNKSTKESPQLSIPSTNSRSVKQTPGGFQSIIEYSKGSSGASAILTPFSRVLCLEIGTRECSKPA